MTVKVGVFKTTTGFHLPGGEKEHVGLYACTQKTKKCLKALNPVTGEVKQRQIASQ